MPDAIAQPELMNPLRRRLTRRDFGVLRATVPEGHRAFRVTGTSITSKRLPGTPLPLGITVLKPRSWLLLYERAFTVLICGLVDLKAWGWYRLEVPVKLKVENFEDFALFLAPNTTLTTPELARCLNQRLKAKSKLGETINDAAGMGDFDFAQQVIESGLEDALTLEDAQSGEGGILRDTGLVRQEIGEIEWTPVQNEDVQAGWVGPYLPDQRQEDISRLTEGILGLQGLPASEQPHPVETVIGGALATAQVAFAIAGLMAMIWPQLLPWPDLAVHDRVIGLLTTLISGALIPLRRWLRARGTANLLAGGALGEPMTPRGLSGRRAMRSDYHLRANFWDRVSHALAAGDFDAPASSARRAERIVGRLTPRALQAALPDIQTLQGDLAVLPDDAAERRAWLVARSWLTRQTLLKLEAAEQQGETLPDEGAWLRQLDADIAATRSSLHESLAQYRTLGIAPRGGILAPRRSLARTLAVRLVRSRLIQRTRNRTSEAAFAALWLLTRLFVIPRMLWAGLKHIYWPLRNRLSSMCAGCLWLVVRSVRHPFRSIAVALLIAGIGWLYSSATGSAMARELGGRVMARPVAAICAGFAEVDCPFQGAQAQKVCFWKGVPFCPTATPTPMSITASPTPRIGTPAPPNAAIPAPADTEAPTATPTRAPDPVVEPPPSPTSKPVAPPRAPQSPRCADSRAVITQPALDTVVTGALVIRGTATHQRFSYYKLELGVGRDPDQWSWMDLPDYRKAPVVNDVLGTWNVRDQRGALRLPAGVYTIRLVVIDQSGNYPEPCRSTIIVK